MATTTGAVTCNDGVARDLTITIKDKKEPGTSDEIAIVDSTDGKFNIANQVINNGNFKVTQF